jgi:phosphinothricin acetyltransferase
MMVLVSVSRNASAGALIRPATIADAADISRIHNASIAANDSTMQERPTQVSDAKSLVQSNDGRSITLVLEIERQVVGWGRVWPYSTRAGYRFAAETAIFLDKQYRGKGLGTMLQSALVTVSRQLGYHHLVAKIFAENAVSIQMHLRIGYERVGIQREIGHKGDSWRDVAILQFIHAGD